IDDKHAGAGRRLDEIGTSAGRPARIVEGPDQARLAGDEDEGLALIESMIAECHAIRARREKVGADRLGDPKAAGGVLAIDDNAIEAPGITQFRQIVQENRAARAANDVADEEEAHAKAWPGSRSIRAP